MSAATVGACSRTFSWLCGTAKRCFIAILKAVWTATRWNILYGWQWLVTAAVASAGFALIYYRQPWDWLPEHNDRNIVLAALLGAQAAIAALTLALTVFVLQGVHTRIAVENPIAEFAERLYRAYIQRLWVKNIMPYSLLAVATTGLVLAAENIINSKDVGSFTFPNLDNLILIAMIAFEANLVLPLVLFERTIHLLSPSQWANLSIGTYEMDIRQAIRAFGSRLNRAATSLRENRPDISTTFPVRAEGTADQAIRGLLEEAQKAMKEGRQGEFNRTIEIIKGLMTFALDEMEKTKLSWGPPGSQAEWPPLRELNRNLYPFRQEVIGTGTEEHKRQLRGLDYWLVTTGLTRQCGELFTSGLTGYEMNYQIANSYGSPQQQRIFRDEFGTVANELIFLQEPVEFFPYGMALVHHQERMLYDAIRRSQPEDYRALHTGFRPWMRMLRDVWNTEEWPPPPETELHEQLEREYRVALMGLAGRAVLDADSNTMSEWQEYINAARGEYQSTEALTRDIARALDREEGQRMSLWSQWEMEGAHPGQVYSINSEQYPLAFFSVRLMELTPEANATLDLNGFATRARDWFVNNSHLVETLVILEQGLDPTQNPTIEERRQFTLESLNLAIRRDEISEEYDIAHRRLSTNRVEAFVQGVRTAAIRSNPIEEIFRAAGTFVQLGRESEDKPVEKGFNTLVPKAFLSENLGKGGIFYTPLEGDRWGRDLAYNITLMLCEILKEAPQDSGPLNNAEAVLQSIDAVEIEFGRPEQLLLLLLGDWFEVEMELNRERPDGYQPQWQLQEPQLSWRVGRYHGHPFVRGPREGHRRIYIVDPATWGTFVRSQFEDGQEIKVKVAELSEKRAKKLLCLNPNYFQEEPDEESQLSPNPPKGWELEVC